MSVYFRAKNSEGVYVDCHCSFDNKLWCGRKCPQSSEEQGEHFNTKCALNGESLKYGVRSNYCLGREDNEKNRIARINESETLLREVEEYFTANYEWGISGSEEPELVALLRRIREALK